MSMLSRPRKASMAAEPVSPEVAPTMVARWPRCGEDVIHQPRQDLHGDVLEAQRRAVEELEDVVARARSRRAAITDGMAEGRVGVVDELAEVGGELAGIEEAAR